MQSLVFLAAFLSLGCGTKNPPSSAPAKTSNAKESTAEAKDAQDEASRADAKVSNTKKKIEDALDAAADAAHAKLDEYARQMHERLDELDAKYEELKDHAAEAEGQAKTDLEKKLAKAKAKRDDAAKKFDELKKAGVDHWEKIKEEMGSALDDLKGVFE
jgi:dsDNA-specific endonuclease/ATPase MutS2